MEKKVFLGLGSNLGKRDKNLAEAIDRISGSAGHIIASSLIYETEPWGFRSRNQFMNMVVAITTLLKPEELLEEILKTEVAMGRRRVKGAEYSSRIIDIDILLFGDEIINKPFLKIPHPKISERKFVLVPLCDIASGMIHPVLKKTFAELLRECKDETRITKTDLSILPPHRIT